MDHASAGGESLVFTDNPEICDAIARVLSSGSVQRVTVLEGGIAAALEAPMPDAPTTIVDISSSPDPITDIAMLSEVVRGRIVALGPINDVAFYRSLASAGAADYMVIPPTDDMLVEALTPPVEKPTEEAESDSCRVTAVIGARGGVGATTIALNIAWCLAHNLGQRTGLIDLDLHFGTCALSLDLLPGRGLRDALDNPERIDPLFIASAMVNESENLFILGGEEPLENKSELNTYAVDPLVGALKSNFSALVYDLPRTVAVYHPRLIQTSTEIIIVTDFSLSGMRDVLRLKSFVNDFGSELDARIVAVESKDKRGVLSQKDFEKGIEGQIDFVIPYDPALANNAANGGKAIVAQKAAKGVGKVISTIAESLVAQDNEDEDEDDKPKKKKSWWKK
jgi:pilus assembly protein CpaE